MNAIDKWEAEEAAVQMAIIQRENLEFAALSDEEKVRIIKEQRDRLEAFADAAEAAESDEDEDEDD